MRGPSWPDLIQATQLIALRDVLAYKSGKEGASQEYMISRIQRWYSKTFHTPLADVEAIPYHDLLQIWWWEQFEDREPDELETVKNQILQTKEELHRLQRAEDEMDAVTFDEIKREEALAREEAQKQQKRGPLGGPTPIRKSKLSQDAEINDGYSMPPISPGIKMTFVNEDEDLGLDDDAFGLLR